MDDEDERACMRALHIAVAAAAGRTPVRRVYRNNVSQKSDHGANLYKANPGRRELAGAI